MGCEDFQIVLKAPQTSLSEASDVVCSISGVLNDSSSTPQANEQYFQYKNNHHIIELELRGDVKQFFCWISCRFSLCHPISIDEVFIDFIKRIAKKLLGKAEIEVVDEVPNNLPYKFLASDMNGFENSVKKAIEVKRTYWILDFGDEQVTLTTREALAKFCDPCG